MLLLLRGVFTRVSPMTLGARADPWLFAVRLINQLLTVPIIYTYRNLMAPHDHDLIKLVLYKDIAFDFVLVVWRFINLGATDPFLQLLDVLSIQVMSTLLLFHRIRLS